MAEAPSSSGSTGITNCVTTVTDDELTLCINLKGDAPLSKSGKSKHITKGNFSFEHDGCTFGGNLMVYFKEAPTSTTTTPRTDLEGGRNIAYSLDDDCHLTLHIDLTTDLGPSSSCVASTGSPKSIEALPGTAASLTVWKKKRLAGSEGEGPAAKKQKTG